MADRTQAQLIELAIKAIPYSNQITGIEFPTGANSIKFTWRGSKYLVTSTLHTAEIINSCEHGNDKAILLAQCLKQAEELYNV